MGFLTPGVAGGGGVSSVPGAIKYLLANGTGEAMAFYLDDQGIDGDIEITWSNLTVGALHGIFNDAAVLSFSAPNFVSLAASLNISGNAAMTSVAFANLTTLQAGVELDASAGGLTTVDFPELTTLGLYAKLLLNGNSLTVVDLSSLASIAGTVDIHGNTGLTNLTLPASISTTNGFIFDASGCALTEAKVSAILSAFLAGIGATDGGTINLSGGTNAAPTDGGSNQAYQDLVAAGINVSIN